MRLRASRFFVLLLLAALLSPACSGAGDTGPQAAAARPSALPPDQPWARVLERFQDAGGLDYAGLQAAPEDLDSYLDSLGGARPEEFPREDRIAFWCNAYNAVTTHFVLDLYPEIESVRVVDGFFDKRTFSVAGEQLTLDTIEDRARAEGDPRVHFALVCASTSCPDLRSEPYRGAELDRQLEEQTRAFLADPEKGLRFTDDEIWLSSIFKWYAGDFTGGRTVVAFFARSKLLSWILPHLPEDLAQRIEANEPAVKYLDYDWSLNDR